MKVFSEMLWSSAKHISKTFFPVKLTIDAIDYLIDKNVLGKILYKYSGICLFYIICSLYKTTDVVEGYAQILILSSVPHLSPSIAKNCSWAQSEEQALNITNYKHKNKNKSRKINKRIFIELYVTIFGLALSLWKANKQKLWHMYSIKFWIYLKNPKNHDTDI